MRARLGILFAGLTVELREIVLKNKPAQMLAISPKGTVPVLELAGGDRSERLVIEESREIVEWALRKSDPGKSGTDLFSLIYFPYNDRLR
ncbi:glutathione S-transferase [Marinobacter salarius]|uniref:Glutathione S-transferase n=1 Tax=Marinobacter salarius TaxID=1420917 RepID=A0A1W6K6W2_9GAMM|nr:glutathione S-transferase [Marinobacter salarius]